MNTGLYMYLLMTLVLYILYIDIPIVAALSCCQLTKVEVSIKLSKQHLPPSPPLLKAVVLSQNGKGNTLNGLQELADPEV
jgi:hypothetical protein